MLGLELEPANLERRLAGVSSLLETQQSFDVLRGGELVGRAGAVRPASIDAPAWAAPLFGLEVILPDRHTVPDSRYQTLPVLPAVEIDLALLVPDKVSADAVESMLRQGGGALLEEVQAFDLYRGSGIPERTRSIAYRLRFRAPDRTLTDADVRTVVGRILKRLKDEHGIERRG
jgi:phenylalanyl-tRNA synthetase beta chain